MSFGGIDIVAVVEIVAYTPLLILAIIVASRHGWRKASGWTYTTVLCLLRILGSICQLVSIHHPSTNLTEVTFILDFIGLSPLLFATLGLLSRALYWINVRGGCAINNRHFWLAHMLISVAAILCIAGGVGNSSGSPSTTLKVGVILYMVAFAAITLYYTVTLRHKSLVPVTERRIFISIAVAWPFLLVRLVYAVIANFGHDREFSLVGGSIGIRVGMATIEEFLVVLNYVMLGLALQALAPGERTQLRGPDREWKK